MRQASPLGPIADSTAALATCTNDGRSVCEQCGRDWMGDSSTAGGGARDEERHEGEASLSRAFNGNLAIGAEAVFSSVGV